MLHKQPGYGWLRMVTSPVTLRLRVQQVTWLRYVTALYKSRTSVTNPNHEREASAASKQQERRARWQMEGLS
jgi:hypothetical protein